MCLALLLQALVELAEEAMRLEASPCGGRAEETAELLSGAVGLELMALPEACRLFPNGASHPLGLMFLKSLADRKGKEWLTTAFALSPDLSCLQLLPGMLAFTL